MNEALKRKINDERLLPPEQLQSIPETRRAGTEARWAFCKTAAGTGSTLVCFLDKDGTGKEVTVHFELLGGIENLSDGHLSLVDGSRIRVAKDGSDWWCETPIEGTEEKDCDA